MLARYERNKRITKPRKLANQFPAVSEQVDTLDIVIRCFCCELLEQGSVYAARYLKRKRYHLDLEKGSR